MDGVSLAFVEPPMRGTRLNDHEAMQLALNLAVRGRGLVEPNPSVGCVVLDEQDRLIGYGYHEAFGQAHAEVNALDGLTDDQLRKASVFVTLEPCAHHGKTPPCADLLLSKPLARVVYGLKDPNPQVSGRGAKKIQEAGIEVRQFGDLKDELEESCEHFLFNQRFNRPFVSLKVATSLDGMMALNTGESRWITGIDARNYSHFLRASHDAILVGQGTFSVDDPSLNIRHPRFPGKKNKVIVLDPTGGSVEELKGSKVVESHQKEDILYVVTEGTEEQLRPLVEPYAEVLGIRHQKAEGFVLPDLLEQVWSRGIHSVLVEGGAQTLGAFISAGLAQRLYLFQAPHLLGAGNSLSWTEGLSINKMRDKRELGDIKRHILGKDQLITGRFLEYNNG